MHVHNDPNDIVYRSAIRLQTRELTGEQVARSLYKGCEPAL